MEYISYFVHTETNSNFLPHMNIYTMLVNTGKIKIPWRLEYRYLVLYTSIYSYLFTYCKYLYESMISSAKVATVIK